MSRDPYEPIDPVAVEDPPGERAENPEPLPEVRPEQGVSSLAPVQHDGDGGMELLMPGQLNVGRYCDTCVIRDKCPAYEEHAGCSLTSIDMLNTPGKVMEAVQYLMTIQFERVQQAAMVERVQGGHYDPNVTKGMIDMLEMAKRIKELGQDGNSVRIEAKGKKGTGILAALFGGGGAE